MIWIALCFMCGIVLSGYTKKFLLEQVNEVIRSGT